MSKNYIEEKNNVDNQSKTWHEKHAQNTSVGDKIADSTASFMGSWKFIIGQTVFVALWMTLNCVGIIYHWDAYPFILLNLLFSTQAAYSAPIIMMAQNRQNDRDRYQAKEDFVTNVNAKKEIEELQKSLARIENEKLNKIMELLEQKK